MVNFYARSIKQFKVITNIQMLVIYNIIRIDLRIEL